MERHHLCLDRTSGLPPPVKPTHPALVLSYHQPRLTNMGVAELRAGEWPMDVLQIEAIEKLDELEHFK